MESIIKRIEELEYSINGSELDNVTIRRQLSELAAIVNDLAYKVTNKSLTSICPQGWKTPEQIANYFSAFEDGFDKEHFKISLANAIKSLICNVC